MAADSPCGDWEPYKNEKCFKIFDNVGLQTYDNAIKTCQQQENGSNLVYIHYLEEQEFFSSFLFKTHKVVDGVWIGAKYSSNKFKWTDDSDLSFTNWAEGSPSNTADKACVQMIAEGSSMGKWVTEPCNKSNKVVCQKMQTWSLSRLQKIVLNLMNNPVPIGFIYVQLPSQPEPKTLWPTVEWKDVTSHYAGLFFRAEGGGSAAFGATQNGDSPKLVGARTDVNSYNPHISIAPGAWSSSVLSSGTPFSGDFMSLKFFVSSVETRPINKAVRIWKRAS